MKRCCYLILIAWFGGIVAKAPFPARAAEQGAPLRDAAKPASGDVVLLDAGAILLQKRLSASLGQLDLHRPSPNSMICCDRWRSDKPRDWPLRSIRDRQDMQAQKPTRAETRELHHRVQPARPA